MSQLRGGRGPDPAAPACLCGHPESAHAGFWVAAGCSMLGCGCYGYRPERAPSGVYIGPERRKGERRSVKPWDDVLPPAPPSMERRCIERRQGALAGVIVGMSAEDMSELAALWRRREEGRVVISR